jgi:hypothetical protein
MKFKIFVLYTLVLGNVFGQAVTDTTNNEPIFDKPVSHNNQTINSNIITIPDSLTWKDAFEQSRLDRGANQKFKWRGKLYHTNYDGERPLVIGKIEDLYEELTGKLKLLDNSINKADSQRTELQNLITKIDNESKTKIQLLDRTITDQQLYWIIAILILLLILVAVFFFLKTKVSQQQDSISSVKDTQEKLSDEAIILDTKLIQILEQKLEIEQQQPQPAAEVNHSLPLKLAEEIHRMRKRLKTMEESQGTKVLNKRIESLEDKINDMGYELVNLEGQTFNEGMTVDARFIPDENLKEGEEIITRVIKPQVNYKDTLIQAAQVEVAQGI